MRVCVYVCDCISLHRLLKEFSKAKGECVSVYIPGFEIYIVLYCITVCLHL